MKDPFSVGSYNCLWFVLCFGLDLILFGLKQILKFICMSLVSGCIFSLENNKFPFVQ
jgi:hypothetical protein